MYKYYKITLQIRWYNCEEVVQIVRSARSLKEAGLRARQAAKKFQNMTDDGGWVSIVSVQELVSEGKGE